MFSAVLIISSGLGDEPSGQLASWLAARGST